MRLLALAVLLGSSPSSLVHLESLSAVERRRAVEAMPLDEREAAMRRLDAGALAALYRRSLAELGAYRFRMEKLERLNGELFGPVEMVVYVREAPLAIRAAFVGGPGKGRRALFNEKLRPKELRVREPGVASLFGALWIRTDHPLTRRESNHSATDVRLGFVAQQLEGDAAKAQPFGGHTVEPEGFDEAGSFCTRLKAPAGASGLYAQSLRVCTDPALGLPVLVEVHDAAGLVERLRFRDVTPIPDADDAFFTPEKAGL